ncbi:MAG TPA: inositol monophosphatase family protein [Candidatus Micrarchaeaceae archaeon]|nr:inositol monophosphatase family protein [Candidatus Micrarchaeaceae archaeon]
MSSNGDLPDLRLALATARYAVQAGGAVIKAAGVGFHATETKGPGDYVTAVDRESEEVVIRILSSIFPDLPILAEEQGGGVPERGWVVDPLDGTTNFSRGFPMVGVSVALLEAGEPVVAAVHAPFLGFTYTAALGEGAHDQAGRRLEMVDVDPKQAVVSTGFPFKTPEQIPRLVGTLERVLHRVEDLRRPGAASLDLALTAAGVFDGFFELGLKIWDIAAGALLVTEAGGVVSDWEGAPGLPRSGNIVAGSPRVHAALLEATRAR